LKYNFSSSHNLSNNGLWKLYQNKLDDKIVTPAHLLLLPTENGKTANFFSCSNIGSNTLKGSESFTKVRNFSKTYTTNLISAPNPISNKYFNIHNVYFNDNNYLNTINYGFNRQHNLISSSATTNNFSTFFDSSNNECFLDYTLSYSHNKNNSPNFFEDNKNYSPLNPLNSELRHVDSLKTLFNSEKLLSSTAFLKFLYFSSPALEINGDSDKNAISYPVYKLLNLNIGSTRFYKWDSFRNLMFLDTRGSRPSKSSLGLKTLGSKKIFSSVNNNNKILSSDQSVRQYDKIKPSVSHYNLSDGTNTLTSNLFYLNRSKPSSTLLTNFFSTKSNYSDLAVVGNTLSNRYYASDNKFPNLSTNPYVNTLDHNNMEAKNLFTSSLRNTIETKIFTKPLEVVDLLQGSREKSPESINSAY
jgi:hypothetical protein